MGIKLIISVDDETSKEGLQKAIYAEEMSCALWDIRNHVFQMLRGKVCSEMDSKDEILEHLQRYINDELEGIDNLIGD